MNFSTEFLPEALTSALGWALLHSLWQGALAGLVLALLLILLNRHSAKVRYTVTMLGLATVLVLFVVTFTRFYTAADTARLASGTVVAYSAQLEPASSPAVAAPLWERLMDAGKHYFAAHLPLLVSLWLLGLLVMSLRFLGGLAYTQRLRHYRTQTLGLHWQETLQQVKQSMGVRHGVRLVESALVQVPMAIGYFKPVILFPIGAVTGLSQRQVEAVLAHELAHVLRHDYLLNMLQQVVETIFFFHPAVWWMSAVARTEREHCCDDLAVKACGDRVTYARALAQLEALRMPAAPVYALALTGNKGSLLSRVKRLVSSADLRPSFGEGFMAALVVVGGFLLLSFGAWAGMKQEPQTDTETALAIPSEEATPATATEVVLPEPEEEALMAATLTIQDSTGKNSDVIIIKNKKGEISELYVNGKRIPKKDIPEFQKLIDQRLQATKRAPRMKKAERALAIKETEEALKEVRRDGRSYNYTYTYTGPDSMRFDASIPPAPPVPPIPPVPGMAPMPGVPPLPPMPPRPPMAPLTFGAEDSKATKEAQERYRQSMKKYEQDIARYSEEMEKYAAEVESSASRRAEAANARTRVPDARRQEAMAKRHEANMKRHEENMRRHETNMKSHEERQEILEKVRLEMIKDGLLKEGEQVTDFKIDKDALYIKGQKQPQALHTKYRNLMKTKDGKHFDLSYKRDGNKVQIQSTQQ